MFASQKSAQCMLRNDWFEMSEIEKIKEMKGKEWN